MEVRASAKFQRFSPRKARLVTDLITGKTAEEAIAMLENLPKGTALPIGRVVRSAVAGSGCAAADGATPSCAARATSR